MTHVALQTPSCLARSLVSGKLAERCAGDEGLWLTQKRMWAAADGAGPTESGRGAMRDGYTGRRRAGWRALEGTRAGAWEEIRFRWAERGGGTSIGAGKERAEALTRDADMSQPILPGDYRRLSVQATISARLFQLGPGASCLSPPLPKAAFPSSHRRQPRLLPHLPIGSSLLFRMRALG